MLCPICEKRKPGRFCPAKAEKICPVCCGTEREKSIDCPSTCAYLTSAHRYEDQHPRTIPSDTPLLDVRLSQEVIHRHGALLSALAFTIAKFCSTQPSATDPDVLAALQGAAETYRTLSSGILYERAPEIPVQRALYSAIMDFLAKVRDNQATAEGVGPVKDAEIFQSIVFLYRMGLLRTNGRPRARGFIEFLRGQFPASQELKREESRIIVP